MNNKRKITGVPLRAVLLYVALCTFVIIGVTFSKYIVSSTSGDSARVVEFKNISITEGGGALNEDGTRKFIVTPGVDIEKKATLSFGGAETAAYIFLEVDANGWKYESTNTFYLLENSEANKRIKFEIDSAWALLTKDGNKYIYYMELEPNTVLEDIPIIKDGAISVDWQIKNSELQSIAKNLSVTFKATAVQRNSFEESDKLIMWDSVKAN